MSINKRLTREESRELIRENERQIRLMEPRPPAGYKPSWDEVALKRRGQSKAPTGLPNNGTGLYNKTAGKLAKTRQRYTRENRLANKLGNVRPGCKRHTVKLSRAAAFMHQVQAAFPGDTRLGLIEKQVRTARKTANVNHERVTITIGLFTQRELGKIGAQKLPNHLRRK